MTTETCRSEVGLDFLAEGMAKQYDDYQSALQELLDNAVSGIVKSEDYFNSPEDTVYIEISITRDVDSVRTVVADNGPGIPREALRKDVFRTGNTSVSEGILNNVGWGLKASLAWFESTLPNVADGEWFELVTQTCQEGPISVEGPITGELPISQDPMEDWTEGLADPDDVLSETPHGTRVRVSCTREQFDDDLWPSGTKLDLKVQALRERLGILFRRLLDVREDNRIIISYEDLETGANESYEVLPLFPTYRKSDSDSDYGSFEFSVGDGDGNTFDVHYEKGTMDFGAMREEYEGRAPRLFTSGGNFRTRYRPSQAKQGVDVYANGRVLMTSVFSDLFDLTRNNQYNYFGGTLRIIPRDPHVEVSTDNRKTRIDKSSTLWANLREILVKDPYLPVGKSYQEDSTGDSLEDEALNEGETSEEISSASIPSGLEPQSLFGMHHADSRNIRTHLQTLEGGDLPSDGLVDLTITSPPYADVKDYAMDPRAQVGYGDSYQEYLAELRDIFAQVYHVTKPSGSLWLVANTFKQNGLVYNLPWDLAAKLQDLHGDRICPNCSTADTKVPLVQNTNHNPYRCMNCGHSSSGDGSWQLQDIAIWDKQRALPYSGQGKLRNVFEYILFFTKSSEFTFDLDEVRIADISKFKEWWVDYPERYHPRGMVPSNVWDMVTPAQGSFGFENLDHPAPFPPQLVERMLRLTSTEGSTILDPFAGSGMVLAMAEMLDRNPIGFELSEPYCESYPAFREELREKVDLTGSKSTATQQNQLAQIIGGLRQTKQVQRILLHLAEEQNIERPADINIHTVFHVSKAIDEGVRNPRQFVAAEYIFIVDEGTTPARVAELESMINRILRESDARKFGIQASPKVLPPASFVSEFDGNLHPDLQGELFLYGDLHHSYEMKITFDEWRTSELPIIEQESDGSARRFPPIVSNIGLDVNNPRRSGGTDDNRGEYQHEMVRGGDSPSEIANIRERRKSSAD